MIRGKTEKLCDILRNVLSRKAIAGRIQNRQIQEALQNILSSEELRHLKYGGIQNGCLRLSADSQPLIFEMESFRSDEILQRLHELEYKQIKKIRFEFENSEI